MEYRCEEKYLCTPEMLSVLRHRLTPLMRRDKHQGSREYYSIRSLYFDDAEDSGYEDTFAGVSERRKFRLRIYNGDASFIHLEIKSKRNGYTHKDSCEITDEQCRTLMRGGLLPFSTADPEPLRLWNIEMRTNLLRPRIIVEYKRCAFVEPTGNVRITFDEELGFSPITGVFLQPHLSLLPVSAEHRHLLEVKYDQLLPDAIANTIQMDRLRRTSFSKYTICRDANK